MSEAGWGVPDWVPVSARRSIAREEAAEARQARAEQADRERRAEELRDQNLTLAAVEAQRRGEEMTALELATGQLRGRSVQDIFASARAAADRDDARDSARLRRDGYGDPEPVHCFVDEPVIHRAATPTGRKIWRRAERFRAVLEARRKLAEAEQAAEQSKDDYGFVAELRPRPDPVAVVTARAEPVREDVRIRNYSGPIVGIR